MSQLRVVLQSRLLAMTGFACLGVASVSAADVLVVDAAGAPGFDFTDIQPAVNAAAEGDTLLVRAGMYEAFTVDGKSLVIVADADGTSVLVENAVIRNLAANQSVVVHGVLFGLPVPGGGQFSEWLRIADNSGPVWLEECGAGGGIVDQRTHGLRVVNSEDVTLASCGVSGSEHVFLPLFAKGGDGLRIVNSSVNVFDSVLSGGEGSDASSGSTAFPGGDGVKLDNGELWLAGCEVRGGKGGSAVLHPEGCYGPPSVGGAGLRVVSNPATLRRMDTTITGGAGGNTASCFFDEPPDGEALAGSPLVDETFAGLARSMDIGSPAREDETVEFTFTGVDGELAYAALSPEHAPLWFPDLTNVLLSPPTSMIILFIGVVPPSGELKRSYPAPSVNAAVGAFTYYGQAVFVDASLAAYLGAGSAITMLDAAY